MEFLIAALIQFSILMGGSAPKEKATIVKQHIPAQTNCIGGTGWDDKN